MLTSFEATPFSDREPEIEELLKKKQKRSLPFFLIGMCPEEPGLLTREQEAALAYQIGKAVRSVRQLAIALLRPTWV